MSVNCMLTINEINKSNQKLIVSAVQNKADTNADVKVRKQSQY